MTSILITGADGHLGRALTRWLLAATDRTLVLFMRAADTFEAERKRLRLAPFDSEARCRLVFGDLREAEPFAAIEPRGVTDILHCAALTSFAVDRASADDVNAAGTTRLLAFAERCDLRRIGLLSTLYAAGLRQGVIGEVAFDDTVPFANHYEWSKWRAERSLCDRTGLPWQIFRVATILADDERGTVVQQNAVHNTLRLLYYGLLPVLPGIAATRVYATSTDFAVPAIGRLFLDAADHRIFHVSDAAHAALTLGELMERVYESFLRDKDFARQRILKPRFCDRSSFAALVEGADRFGGAIAQSLHSVAPFAPQLYCDKEVATCNATAALGSLRPPDARSLAGAVAHRLAETRWGLRSNVSTRDKKP